jgi:competence protein ComEC
VTQLARPQRFWNDETGDPRPGEARRATLLSGGIVDAQIVSRGWGPGAWIDRVRAHVRARIEATFPVDTAPMARALVLGESDLADADDADFRASGLAHLLAVSGMHLVLVVAGAVKLMHALLVRVAPLSARTDVGRFAAGIALPIVWIYADFAGAGGSTVRAAWMMSAALAARAWGRRGAAARSFGLSLLAMGALDPLVVHDVSFLLSAGATAGLIALSRPLASAALRLSPAGPPWLKRAVSWLVTATSATLAATIPCAPILARFAPTLPAGGVAANLLAVPMGESIALPVCLVHALISPFPSAERGCALVASGALAIVRAIAHAFAHAHWLLVDVPPPNAWQLACVAVAMLAMVTPGSGRLLWVVSLLALMALFELEVRHSTGARGVLRVTFLDVGQGDAALVDLPSGEAMLIDGGGLVGSPVDTGTRVVAPTLRARRRSDLLTVILSHPHPDHFTGLASGLDGVHVGSLWDTGQGEREGVGGGYATLLANARDRHARILRPHDFCGARDLGGARVEVLAPCPDSTPDRGPNDNSIVARITYGARAFLFVGDAESEEEGDLLALGADRLRADVLKVGHHGSRTSSSPAFVRAVSPREAVISVGVRNRFGHPHPTTLKTLASARVRLWRTDRDGEVTAWTDGSRLEVGAASREGRIDLW